MCNNVTLIAAVSYDFCFGLSSTKQMFSTIFILKKLNERQKGQIIGKRLILKYIWAASWQNQQNDFVPSEDWDQPGHLSSRIRVFAVCSMGS